MARSPSRICPVVVGRERELACGAALLTEAAAGRGQVLLLSGEAGIGKSRLACALMGTASWRGFQTIIGVCQEQDRDCPYAPFLDAVRFLLHRGGSDASAAIAEQDRAVLARLVPELGMTGDEPVATLPPEHEKRRIFEAFVHFCLALSRDTPLTIVLEDLHWADATSLDLIQLLARRLASARTFLLATARSDEPGDDLAAWLSALARGRFVTRLALAPLTEPDVAAMIAATADSPLPLPVVSAINARAEGNPFLVEELLHALVEETADQARWDGADGIIAGQVPTVVAQTVARRLGALDRDARTVAEAGAAIGRRFSFDLLRHLTRLDEAALIGVLRQLVAAHLVIEERIEARAVFAFRHALTREAIYHRLLEPERRQQHRRIARVFATQTGDWPAPSDDELG
ncbi:MAG: AAA family ATPase [Chloroflexota bacterium]|nr:AAA family ATPase [Chloroflexota bacterium]